MFIIVGDVIYLRCLLSNKIKKERNKERSKKWIDP